MTKKKREKKLIEVVDFEPMVSGNSCQEYTVDIAFQIPGSRTYIFMKTMALPRFCNTLFHVAILILPSLQCLVILMLEDLTRLLRLILTNLFATCSGSCHALESTMNHRAHIYQWFKQTFDTPTRWNFLMLISIFVLMSYLYHRSGINNCIVVTIILFMIFLFWLK